MTPYCIVPGCVNRSKKVIEGVHFHQLPAKNPVLMEKWMNNITLLPYYKFKRLAARKSSRICSLHFTPDSYVRNLKSELLGLKPPPLLKGDAIPTIFQTGPSPSPMQKDRVQSYVKDLQTDEQKDVSLNSVVSNFASEKLLKITRFSDIYCQTA